MTFHYRYRKQIILGIIVILLFSIITAFSVKKYLSNKSKVKESVVVKKKEKKIETVENELLLVDIKGEVVSPGIYELDSNSRVIDVINKAGGLTENANTEVINLSKKIIDEMVIIIYSNAQVEDFSKTKEIENKVIDSCNQADENSLHNDACISKDNSISSSTKVSINTGTLEELMNIPGVGESKAKSIIEYRTSNGNFKTIEDIKNVSGIGDSLFAKIKDYITI